MSSERSSASERLKTEIERTRADMDETLDALGDRLHPDRLIEPVRRAHERLAEATRSAPWAVLGGAALLGLILGRRR